MSKIKKKFKNFIRHIQKSRDARFYFEFFIKKKNNFCIFFKLAPSAKKKKAIKKSIFLVFFNTPIIAKSTLLEKKLRTRKYERSPICIFPIFSAPSSKVQSTNKMSKKFPKTTQFLVS